MESFTRSACGLAAAAEPERQAQISLKPIEPNQAHVCDDKGQILAQITCEDGRITITGNAVAAMIVFENCGEHRSIDVLLDARMPAAPTPCLIHRV